VKTITTIPMYLLLTATLALAACGGERAGESADGAAGPAEPAAADTPTAAVQETAPADLATLLARESRSQADRDRDAGRKPAEVIDVLGIEPGMNVIDIIAASGWYTEVLSLAVGPNGHVVSQNPPSVLQRRDGANEKALSERLADNRLPNVSRLDKDIEELVPEDGPFDAAITALNLHDIYNRGGEEAAVGMMLAVYSVLKPGGVFGVIDHQGLADQDNAALHRMVKADAIRVAEAAGFVVETDSGILHHHSDDMTAHMRDIERGHTHRFLLKLRKPE